METHEILKIGPQRGRREEGNLRLIRNKFSVTSNLVSLQLKCSIVQKSQPTFFVADPKLHPAEKKRTCY